LLALLAWVTILPAAPLRETLFDDVQLLRADAQGVEFRLQPRLLGYGEDRDGLRRLDIARCPDRDRPVRRLRLALPPGAEHRLQLLGSRSESLPGAVDGAGFMGSNPEPVVRVRPETVAGLQTLLLEVELLRVNGEPAQWLSELSLRVDFLGGAHGTAPELPAAELEALLLNPGQAAGWALPRLLRREGATAWDGSDWLRIPIEQEGLYRIRPADLGAAGLDPALLDPANFKLYGWGGQAIDEDPQAASHASLLPPERPMIRQLDGQPGFTTGDLLLFYAEGLSGYESRSDGSLGVYSNPYGQRHDLWLLVGGVQPGRSAAPLAASPAEGETPLSLERLRWRDLVAERSNLAGVSSKLWFGDAFANAGARASYDFAGPALASGELRVDFLFYPDSGNGDLVLILLDDQPMGEPSTVTTRFRSRTGSVAAGAQRITVEKTASARTHHLRQLQLSYEVPPTFVGGIFRGESPAQPGLYAFNVAGMPADGWLLDVTDPDSLRATPAAAVVDRVPALEEGGTLGRVRRYYGAGGAAIRNLAGVQRTPLPDLKAAAGTTELIVIAPAAFAEPARRLVDHKNALGRTPARLALLEEVLAEFAGTAHDPGGIRNFLRHDWLASPGPQPRFVLLVGNGHYDPLGRVAGGYPERLPAWYDNILPSPNMTDDFFAMMNTSSWLDLIVGRLPANTLADVERYVDKVLAYESSVDAGFWRNRMLFVADDEHGEGGRVNYFETTHSTDAEELIRNHVPERYDIERLYLFDFPSVYNPEIRIYEKPAASQRLIDALNEGVALVSYMGHGNNTTWADEYVFNAGQHFNQLRPTGRPALFIAATCSWAEIDLPVGLAFPQQLINMAGGGAIGVLAASRATGGPSNENFSRDLLPVFFDHDINGTGRRTLAEAIRLAKNANYDWNRRKYLYLGDPSLLPGFPQGRGELHGVTVAGQPADTLLTHALAGLQARTWEGDQPPALAVREGLAEVRVREAPVQRRHDYDPYTNSNDEYHGRYLLYEQPGPLLYAGAVPVEDGEMLARFVVPADATGGGEAGRVRMYYHDLVGELDGLVYADDLPIAVHPDPPTDTVAPLLRVSFNGPAWREEDWLAPNSTIIVRVEDESGVNLTGEIGHRIEMEIDGGYPEDLTADFRYDLGSYTSGQVERRLPALEPGIHQVRVRAFDNFNNPGYAETSFRVLDGTRLELAGIVNFPNPVRGTTRFTFQVRGLELEDPGDLELAVYTVKGRRVAHRRLELQSAGGQLFSEDWRPVNDLGDPLGRGVYLYRLKLPLPAISYSLIDDLGQAQTRRIGAQTLEGTGKMIVE
jgi:hypothetical protein